MDTLKEITRLLLRKFFDTIYLIFDFGFNRYPRYIFDDKVDKFALCLLFGVIYAFNLSIIIILTNKFSLFLLIVSMLATILEPVILKWSTKLAFTIYRFAYPERKVKRKDDSSEVDEQSVVEEPISDQNENPIQIASKK